MNRIAHTPPTNGAEGELPSFHVQSASTLTWRGWLEYAGLVAAWAVVNINFWIWWLRPEHSQAGWMYWPLTAALAYSGTLLTTMYLYFVGHMRRPVPIDSPDGVRVALITLCVPGAEGLEVIERQLVALARVNYPHDSWVLDEGGTLEVHALATRCGVRYFTRSGIDRYNQAGPPFKAKTKAGNVNAWLDAHGSGYDVFVQFDIDHTPREDYLDRVLGYFQDEHVAWVQAPSIYGNRDNWVARGAAEQELVLQGPLQEGFYGLSETPFIIGSHTTYRTAAIREIGGFQPTRAEDHLDTLVLAAHGYRGVFVPEPIAVGAGAETFDTFVQQQFAWAMSLVQVLLGFAPRLVWRLRLKQALQFLFAESWYPLSSAALLTMTLMAPLALVTHQQPANVGLVEFLVHWLPVGAVAVLIWIWTRPWRMPPGLGLSWRTAVLYVARWPVVLWAFVNVVLRISHSYMITRKGSPPRDRRTRTGDRRAGVSSGPPHGAAERRMDEDRRRGERRAHLRVGPGPVTTLRSRLLYLVVVWCLQVVVLWFITLDAWGLGGGSPAEHARVQGFTLLVLSGIVFFLGVYAANVLGGAIDLWRQSHRFLRVARDYGLAISVLLVTGVFWLLLLNESVAGVDVVVETHLWPGRALIPASAPGLLASLRTTAPEILPTSPQVASMHDLAADRVTLGAYDPEGGLRGLDLPLEHWFLSQNQTEALPGILAQARDRQSIPLVTIEPYPLPGETTSVLESVARGEQDEQITPLARAVADAGPQIVLIRWGHEMDLPNLYPWSSPDAAAYRAAYQHVASVFREQNAFNARWVWSPSGNTPASEFYPGDDLVDYVGMTVLEDERWDRLLGDETPRSFVGLLGPKYPMLAPYGKPMIIAELGVSGTREHQREWLTDAVQPLPEFPLIRAVSYQNAVNAPNNLMPSRPDWRISPELFGELLTAIQPSPTHEAF